MYLSNVAQRRQSATMGQRYATMERDHATISAHSATLYIEHTTNARHIGTHRRHSATVARQPATIRADSATLFANSVTNMGRFATLRGRSATSRWRSATSRGIRGPVAGQPELPWLSTAPRTVQSATFELRQGGAMPGFVAELWRSATDGRSSATFGVARALRGRHCGWGGREGGCRGDKNRADASRSLHPPGTLRYNPACRCCSLLDPRGILPRAISTERPRVKA
jgi:hypothetical protein